MLLDLSLKNTTLYAGCTVESVAGRDNLKTPVAEAVEIVGRNIADIVQSHRHERDDAGEIVQDYVPGHMDEITLTGPMAVWSYLIVFHAVVHCFRRVYYDDGRNGKVLIAAHG